MFLPCATACPSFDDAAGATALGEFVAEPALAGSGFGHDADYLSVAGTGLLEHRLQLRHIVVAPDKPCKSARA